MPIDYYMMPPSAPCRAINLTVEALGIADKIRPHKTDLTKGEHLTPEFLKLNPQHTIPTIVDDGFSLWESRAILRYLVNKYGGSNNSLYPVDPKARAVVDQRLDFDVGTLTVRYAAYFYPLYFDGKADDSKLPKLQEALGFLNTFLEGHQYVAGDNLTIADFSLVATVSTIEAVGISITEYPNIIKWYALVKSTAPNYVKANEKPLAEFKAIVESKLKSK